MLLSQMTLICKLCDLEFPVWLLVYSMWLRYQKSYLIHEYNDRIIYKKSKQLHHSTFLEVIFALSFHHLFVFVRKCWTSSVFLFNIFKVWIHDSSASLYTGPYLYFRGLFQIGHKWFLNICMFRLSQKKYDNWTLVEIAD